MSTETHSIRASSHSYFVVLVVCTFYSALAFYLRHDLAGVILFAVSWISIPFLALGDRIRFEKGVLSRTGLVTRLWARVMGTSSKVRLGQAEQVQSEATRSLRRGGNVHYRYRTTIRSRGHVLSIPSGGSDYRVFIREVLGACPSAVLDTRSIELRDFLSDPKDVLVQAESSRIPSAEFLESSFKMTRSRAVSPAGHVDVSIEHRVEALHDLANRLRLSGYLVQALEAFRRALVVRPDDARLLFDFARCLYSFAGLKRSDRLERRALAALRLSERHADGDELLTGIGEWYFQIGEWRQASRVYRSVLDRFGASFRAARGLADVALSEGKIAHVIHQLGSASQLASTRAQRRWSQKEADYFFHLNSDDEYMDLEIGRVNLLEKIERWRTQLLRITLVGLVPILVGVLMEDSFFADLGWVLTSISLFLWSAGVIGVRLLSRRVPYELTAREQ